MRVRELVADLLNLDQDLEVIAVCEDERLGQSGGAPVVFVVDSVDEVRVVMSRSADGSAQVVADNEEGRPRLVIELALDRRH